MLLRSIGSALRGKATRLQVFLATFLAGLLGFVPGFFLPSDLGGGFGLSPGLILLLLFLVLILNANLAIFGLCLLAAKLLSLPLIGVSLAIGRALLDGPLQGLFRLLINAPVTAWFGLEYYATAGGLVLGAIFGGGVGWLLSRALTAIRTQMAHVEESSASYQKWSKKRSVKVLAWAFLGKGKGKKSWQELTEPKRGMPVRIVGLVAVVLIAAGLWLLQSWLSTPMLTAATRSGLASINGATVDLREARLDLGSGLLRLQDLALADATALDTDVFRAGLLEAKVDTGDLLRKRIVIDRLSAVGATSGQPRAVAGELVQQPPEPPPPPPDADAKTLDDYLQQAKLWKQRLDQVRDWLEVLHGSGEGGAAQPPPSDEQIENERQVVGDAKVAARHLIDGAPRLLIRHIDIEGIVVAALGGKIDIHGTNLSTAPALVAEPLSLAFATKDTDKLLLRLTGPAGGKGALGLEFAYRGLPVDSLFSQIKLQGKAPLHGGSIDIVSAGAFDQQPGGAAMISLPLQVTLKQTTFEFPGLQPTLVDNLLLPVGIRGAMTSPTISIDDKSLADALVKAGKAELAGFVNAQAGKLLGGKVPGVGDILDPSKSAQQNLDAAQKKAEAEAAKAAEAARQKALEEAQKRLKGLLPGGKKN